MQRIATLLQKLSAILQNPEPKSVIDMDLMLDYTRVLYADLLEWRGNLKQQSHRVPQPGEPTLDELTALMEERLNEAGDDDEAAETVVLSEMARRLDIAVPFRRPPQQPEPVAVAVAVAEPEPAPAPLPSPHVEEKKIETPKPIEAPVPAEIEAPIIAATPHPEAPAIHLPPPVTNPLPPIPQKKPDIRQRIGINDKYQFISELFGNDTAGYESAMTALSGLHSMKEAERWMRENLWISENVEDSDALENFRRVLEGFYPG